MLTDKFLPLTNGKVFAASSAVVAFMILRGIWRFFVPLAYLALYFLAVLLVLQFLPDISPCLKSGDCFPPSFVDGVRAIFAR